MTEPFPRDDWYAVAGAAGLASGAVMRARLFGEERVLWRDGEGRAHLWSNRCIHRGMRLHYGFVDGDRLACRYHGWRFGEHGACTRIPAHPDMTPPDDFRIPEYPLREAAGLLWASVGERRPDASGPAAAVGLAGFVFGRTVSLAVDAVAADDALRRSRTDRGESVAVSVHPDGMRVLSDDGGLAALAVAVQPVESGRSQLHVLVRAEPGDAAARQRAAAWGVRFRWFAENGMPADMSWGQA